MKRVIEHTEDGSATLYVPQLDEHYHSVKGARTESQHIFIDMGLKACTAACPHVLEIGFGTGLNALLTLEEAELSNRPVHYTGIELYPLTWEEVDTLKYSTHPQFQSLHQAAWDKEVAITPRFTLHKVKADARTLFIGTSETNDDKQYYDIVYFDAFAPEKQPEMWEEAFIRGIYHALKPGGLLTTYCAKGAIRRMLQQIGFRTERLPGPPGGEREILRATKE